MPNRCYGYRAVNHRADNVIQDLSGFIDANVLTGFPGGDLQPIFIKVKRTKDAAKDYRFWPLACTVGLDFCRASFSR